MSKDKAEEKARDNEVQKYADLYRASLTVVESLSTENAQLREALKELLESTQELATIVYMITSKQGASIEQAKQLLTDNT